MSTVKIYNQSQQEVGEIELDDAVFGVEPKSHLLHLVVRKQRAARRAGTHAVKGRSDVSGGGRKPYKQKGTGRARQGSTRSPQFRGGGVVFGPQPRSYDFKVNKKQMASALRTALSIRAGEGKVVVLDDLAFDAPRTKDFKALLAAFGIEDALFVLEASDAVQLSARNLSQVTVLPPVGLNVYDVLARSTLVLSKDAVGAITERLAPTATAAGGAA